MSLENLALAITHNFPIRHIGDVHNGKVRSVYWFTPEDSRRLVEGRGYPVKPLDRRFQLGAMLISDRISAFNEKWKAEDGLDGVPQKGASLNQTAYHWFNRFSEEGLGRHHILDVPHPLVWIVQKANPVMVEAIARQYITGSMWEAYNSGVREFCRIKLPNGLTKNQRLPELLLTPTTKGILGIHGLPEGDDANLSRELILRFHKELGFVNPQDVDVYEEKLRRGFRLIARDSDKIGQNFVDTKFEFGYIVNPISGELELIYLDEIGTPDSSRYWPKEEYDKNPLKVTEESKEGFRQFLKVMFGKIMTSEDPFLVSIKKQLALGYRVPVEEFMKVSRTYTGIAEKITGRTVPNITDARAEILDSLSSYGIVA